MKLNLHLRTALNVMILIGEYRCTNPDQLYRTVRKIAWERIIPPDEYLTVVSHINTEAVNNSMFASVRVKDGIVDRIQEKTGRRPDAGPERNRVVINLFWRGETAWIYLNTSGIKLADRGYRRNPSKAPLREPLAAALLMAAGYDGTQPLALPMCGSGTLAIEAALMATGRAPGLLRSNFGFTHLQGFDSVEWEALRREARSGAKGIAAPPPIIATDLDGQAIHATVANARTAGVDSLIQSKTCDFAESPLPDTPGILLLNPEYGERLGEKEALSETYARIGDWFKQRCAGWTAFLFTGNLNLAKKVGLKASRRIPFWNAKIDCRLLRYEIYSGSRKSNKNK
jgi:putative N6-adenine-specific DNA methylase